MIIVSFTLWKAFRKFKTGQNAHADAHLFDQLFVNGLHKFIVDLSFFSLLLSSLMSLIIKTQILERKHPMKKDNSLIIKAKKIELTELVYWIK